MRRRIIAERYETLIEALYAGAETGLIANELTFEDGRRGTMRAELAIRDVATAPLPRPAAADPADVREEAVV